jgi:hypothetical protein
MELYYVSWVMSGWSAGAYTDDLWTRYGEHWLESAIRFQGQYKQLVIVLAERAESTQTPDTAPSEGIGCGMTTTVSRKCLGSIDRANVGTEQCCCTAASRHYRRLVWTHTSRAKQANIHSRVTMATPYRPIADCR